VATSINLGYCAWLAGSTWNDTIGRLDVAADTYLGGTTGGVLQSAVNPLQVLASSGLNVTVNPGSAVIPSASGATQGGYRPTNPSTQTLTVATAPSSPNNRIDLIVINVDDLGNSSSFAQLLYVEGTPAASPSPPSAPTDSIVLAQIYVGSGVSSITQANITDERFYAVSPGGVLWCPNMSSLPAGQLGQLGFDMVNQRLFALGASGASPVHVLSFPNVEAIATTAATATFGTELTLLSTNVTTPGGADIEIVGTFCDAFTTYNPFNLQARLYIDSTLVQQNQYYSSTTKIDGTNYRMGAVYCDHQTSSTKGDTPSAGTHTIKFTVQVYYLSSGNTVTIPAASSSPIDLLVAQASV
jgi:hypothetical protein